MLAAEAVQAEIVGLLASRAEHGTARRLAACQAARIWRSALVYRYRCRSPGCVGCWDGSLADWWRGCRRWCQDDVDAFAIALPVDDQFAAPVARALRDLRDRQARTDPTWADVAFLGVTDGLRAYVMISPWHVHQDAVISALRRLWPTLASLDARLDGPSVVTPHVRVALAARRRGSAPLRFAVYPQAQRDEPREAVEPAPFLIAPRPLPWA